MTGGSDDARPPKDGAGAIDDAWDALIEEAGNEEDAVRRVERPISGPHNAVGKDRLAEPDDEMARLMSGAVVPESPPKVSAELFAPPTAKDNATSGEPPDGAVPESEPTDKKDDALAEDGSSAPTDEKDEALARGGSVEPPGTGDATTSHAEAAEASPSGGVERPSLRVVADGESAPDAAEPESRPARANRPAEPSSPEPIPVSEPAGGLPWMWIGVGALVLGAVGFFALQGGGSSEPKGSTPPITIASTELAAPPSSEVDSGVELGPDPDVDAGSPSGDVPPAGDPRPTTRSDDPREPPPGTPPEIAAVFRRLPVSPSDGPPIGGIGANGIHIDDLTMGSEGSNCSGRADDFSVSARDRVGLCVRVVHPREKEELQVLWEKHGGSTRRSKMVVLPKHAYRTRGYLKLRKEYIGDWTVRILSSDGVELARHDFTVVP